MTQAWPSGRGRMGLIWWFTMITQPLNDKPTSSASSTTMFSLPAVKNAFYNLEGLSQKYFSLVCFLLWLHLKTRYEKIYRKDVFEFEHSGPQGQPQLTFCLSHCSTSPWVCKYSRREGPKQKRLWYLSDTKTQNLILWYKNVSEYCLSVWYLLNSGFLFSTGMDFFTLLLLSWKCLVTYLPTCCST